MQLHAVLGVYMPPKISAVRFDGDSASEKKRRKEENQAKKIRDSEVYRCVLERKCVSDYTLLFWEGILPFVRC